MIVNRKQFSVSLIFLQENITPQRAFPVKVSSLGSDESSRMNSHGEESTPTSRKFAPALTRAPGAIVSREAKGTRAGL